MTSITIPCVAISPFAVTAFSMPQTNGNAPPRSSSSLRNLTENTHKGYISPKSASRLKRTVGWLVLRVREKKKLHRLDTSALSKSISFITLTLPSTQVHTDNELKANCLNQFLIELKRDYSLSDYVWRAEKQKNGNLHFHLVCSEFVPHWEIRARWNRIVEKLGYVSRYRAATGKDNPNSTDVHRLEKCKKVARYVAKYCSKNELGHPVQGRLWYASESLQSLGNIVVEIDSRLSNELDAINARHAPYSFSQDGLFVSCIDLFSLDLTDFPNVRSIVDGRLAELSG